MSRHAAVPPAQRTVRNHAARGRRARTCGRHEWTHLRAQVLPGERWRAHIPPVPIVPLYGHGAILERLLHAYRRGTLPASLLLQGPAGVGKQRLALELARALLCTGDQPPCGECQGCRYAAELQHPDLHWYFPRARPKDGDQDAATLRREYGELVQARVSAGGLYAPPDPSHALFVSTVRAIVQTAQLAPALGRRKVFVIGDAETMVPQESSQEAANAFLKLLEEPPADTTLILTSSEPGALLPTIRSRVVSVRVPPLADEDICRFLDDPLVSRALEKAGLPARLTDRIALAGGAPGRLLAGGGPAEASQAAAQLLDAAVSPRRSLLYRAAFVQGAAGARGRYSATLEALTGVLHERARSAALAGHEEAAYRATLGLEAVERAKERAFGNVSPQLVSVELLRALRERLAR